MNLNQVNLMGRPTKILELRYTKDNISMLSFSLAISSSKDTTEFIEVRAYNNQANYLYNYLKDKGRVIISGKLKSNSYENKQGYRVYETVVVTSDVQIIDFKEKDSNLSENYIYR